MSKHMKPTLQQRQQMTGLERLSLRVSAMINHPLAQTQRWVVVHRLDTDGEAEWEEVMGLLAETPELDLAFNDDDTVTLRWSRSGLGTRDDLAVEQQVGKAAPF
ncbi:DUF1654 domain-containing protein [Pseudomonas oryzicola]|uniref:DUF1654 domain-containing protein n=1 Tax=Pseudomonas oryzicola TaxID=485876 RepID=A0ABS6QCK9_9PSED|nr:DUF1654 domain-containing protein [Pseudomonas oryzicola]MBV4491933.1 DUF1654 domain-containing protein [Pseudomonas oryzicola]